MFPKSNCNNGSPANIGIYLNNVGSTISGAFYGPVFGVDGSFPFTGGTDWGIINIFDGLVFDNLVYGINALSSNFQSTGNIFMNSALSGSITSSGINVTAPLTTAGLSIKNYQALVQPTTFTSSTTNGYNWFYECGTGVQANGYNDVQVNYARMWSDKATVPPTGPPINDGYVGVWFGGITNYKYYDNLVVANSMISNYNWGVILSVKNDVSIANNFTCNLDTIVGTSSYCPFGNTRFGIITQNVTPVTTRVLHGYQQVL